MRMKLGMIVLVAGLLAVSCTGAELEENTESSTSSRSFLPKRRLHGPFPRVRALGPVEKIGTPASWSTCAPNGHCLLPFGVQPEERQAAKDLVAELEQDKPSWLRYVREVVVVQVPTNRKRSAFRTGVQLQTGIFIDKAGKALGRKICASLVERYPLGVSVEGVVDPDYNDGKTRLAWCQ
jgi:hypothetical protein